VGKGKTRRLAPGQQTASLSQPPTISFLAESLPVDAREVLASSSTNSRVYTVHDLGLPENTKDEILVPAFCKTVVNSGGGATVIVTRDLGHGDGVMPKVVAENTTTSNHLTEITFSLDGADLPIALQSLFSTPGFKDHRTYTKRLARIHLSKVNDHFQAMIIARSGARSYTRLRKPYFIGKRSKGNRRKGRK